MAARCVWIGHDENGRPCCEHGWATPSGRAWYCPEKRKKNDDRYNHSEKGRARRTPWNHSEAGRSSKQLYDLTRVKAY